MRVPAFTLFAALAPALAAAQPTSLIVLERVEEGRVIAETWCAGCHAVAPDQAAATDAAPAFATLAAADPLRTDAGLAAWIADPQHPVMPDPGLSREQIEAVIAYIRSLRDAAPAE